MATPVASQGLCQARSATTPKKAPVSIMPSIAMLTTPLRSEMTPPSAGSRSTTAAASAACQRFAVIKRWRRRGDGEGSSEVWERAGDQHRNDDGPAHADARVSRGALAMADRADLVAQRRAPQQEGKDRDGHKGDEQPCVDAVDARGKAEHDQ